MNKLAAVALTLLSAPSWAATHVGQINVIPRIGHVVVAVDQADPDGIVDTVLVVETDQSVEAFQGRALIEVTAAGVRVVALDGRMRVVATLAKSNLQTRTGKWVNVPMADVETLDIEPPSVTAERMRDALHAEDAAAQAWVKSLRRSPDPNIRALGGPLTNCPGPDNPDPADPTCYPDVPPDPGGGGGGGTCSRSCAGGSCAAECNPGWIARCACTPGAPPRGGAPVCGCERRTR